MKDLETSATASMEKRGFKAERVDRAFGGNELTSRLLAGEEVQEKRTAHQKVYSLGSGTYQCVLFPEPVHYQDAFGVWQDIDNTLIPDGQEGGTRYVPRGDGLKMSLAATAGDGELVRLTDKMGRSIAWKLEGAQACQAAEEVSETQRFYQLQEVKLARKIALLEALQLKTQETENPKAENQGTNQSPALEVESAAETLEQAVDALEAEIDFDMQRRRPRNLESSLRYEEILPNVDLVCRLNGQRFKDDLILRNADAPSSFVLRLFSSPGLVWRCLEDGTVQAMDAAGTQAQGGPSSAAFVLAPAFAVDANGQRGAVHSMLERDGDGVYLKLQVDAQWLAQAIFPVTVDPVVTPGYNPSTIVGNNVSAASPNTVMNEIYYRVRKEGAGEYRAFIRLPQLPDISGAYTITKATMEMKQMSNNITEYPIQVRSPSQDWDPSTITWNNQPGLEDAVYDFVLPQGYVVGSGEDRPIAAWDITKLLDRWYEGDNFGLCLNTTGSPTLVEYGKPPLLTIQYMAKAGLDGNVPHESMGAGSAGTGHVNLFNGSFALTRGITACNGLRMPVSLTATYNSCPSDLAALSVPMGPGWQMSCDVYLTARRIWRSINNQSSMQNVYTLASGDGSTVDFVVTGAGPSGVAQYADLSGRSLALKETTVTLNGAQITKLQIESKEGTILYFQPAETLDAPIRLEKIVDARGNTIRYVYGKGLLTCVTDGVGRKTLLRYRDGLLDHIVAPGETQGVQFQYDEQGHLVRILDVDGRPADYAYTDDRLTRATGAEGLSLDVEYAQAAPHRAVFLAQSALDGQQEVQGNRRSYAYEPGLTRSTDETVQDGKSIHHAFNHFGNRTNLRDELGFAQITYYAPDGLPNHPASISKPIKTVAQLEVPYTRFDTQPSYTLQLEDGATGSYAYDATTLFMGSRSLKIAKTNALGRAAIPYATLRLEAGKTYTLSAFAITGGGASALASALVPDGQGQNLRIDGDALRTTLDWLRLTVTFDLPQEAAEADGKAPVQLFFSAAEGSGNVYLDCVQLETGEIASSYNILYNGDFHNVNPADNMPVGWTYDRPSGRGYLPTPQPPDGCLVTSEEGKPQGLSPGVMRLYGEHDRAKTISQVIPISGKAGDVFVFGGWARGMATSSQGDTRSFRVRVTLLGVNGTACAHWNDNWSQWQFASAAVKAPLDYTQVILDVGYGKHLNYADFDGIFLYKERFGTAYGFDDKGNVLSMTDLMARSFDATYDYYNNLTQYRTYGKNHFTKLEYAQPYNHLVTKVTTPMNRITEMQYDPYGNRTQERIFYQETHEQGYTITHFIANKAEYSGDGNYLQSQSNSLGKTSHQATDSCRGTLLQVQDPSGQTIQYDYDEKKRLVEALSEADGKAYRNAYTYENGRLATVSHNTTSDFPDVTYTFDYDALGNPTETKVGSQLLSRNVYTQTPDRLPERLEYGNGAQVHYGYDDYKRLTSVRYDAMQAPAVRYRHDQHGRVSRLHDDILHRIEEDQYDGADRLVLHRELEKLPGAASATPLARYLLEYDACSRIKKISETIQDATTYTQYAYNDDDQVALVMYNDANRYTSYAYDQFNRVTRRYRGPGNYASYTYHEGGYPNDGSGGYHYSYSTQIQKIADGSKTWEYTYDDNGNILSEKRNNSDAQILTYQYGRLGQLLRANDPVEGKTWTYAYDRGGNLLEKRTYAFTTGSLEGLTPQSTDTYAYGDANWKDKLTAYNGQAITYDAIGNPLGDGTWTYTWQHGRQLAQMTDGVSTVQYTYNYNGLRVKKTVNGVETHYTLRGKEIVHLKKGSTQMHFYYDGQGKPGLVTYNGSDYYYMYNLQGDVVGLVGPSNQLVVEYRYDPWGKPLTCTGSMAATLGVDNPFRYRGYVFDAETGLFSLPARYYKPEWGRFINADVLMTRNLFAYCNNNPVNMSDPTGCSPVALIPTVEFNTIYANGESPLIVDLLDVDSGISFKIFCKANSWLDYHIDFVTNDEAANTTFNSMIDQYKLNEPKPHNKLWVPRSGIVTMPDGKRYGVGYTLKPHGSGLARTPEDKAKGYLEAATVGDFSENMCMYFGDTTEGDEPIRIAGNAAAIEATKAKSPVTPRREFDHSRCKTRCLVQSGFTCI